MKKRKLMCEYGPFFYQLAKKKERLRRYIVDLSAGHHMSRGYDHDGICGQIVKDHRSLLMRSLAGVDSQLQRNKVHNLKLAIPKFDRIIIRPGETFSFWLALGGDTTTRRGYLPGLTIVNGGQLGNGPGGGLCQLANMIHWLVMHSPLEIVELHHHTDCLFPDAGRRIPFGTGTSISYPSADYRFKNNTDQCVSLHLWMDDTDLCGALLSERPFSSRYRIVEENHHFALEGDHYYRISQIYRQTLDRASREIIASDLILDNHSKVMYDPALIPPDQIRG